MQIFYLHLKSKTFEKLKKKKNEKKEKDENERNYEKS